VWWERGRGVYSVHFCFGFFLFQTALFLGFVYYGICGYWRGLSCILKNSYLVVTSSGLEEINPEISP
jgi:hypothetical protein